jgi:hypothetical protein
MAMEARRDPLIVRYAEIITRTPVSSGEAPGETGHDPAAEGHMQAAHYGMRHRKVSHPVLVR